MQKLAEGFSRILKAKPEVNFGDLWRRKSVGYLDWIFKISSFFHGLVIRKRTRKAD